MSKYAEDDMFINYGKDSKCEDCEKIKKKLERKVGIKQNTIDVLERELRNWKDAHWKLVGVNAKLRDKIHTLEGTDTIL
jgi:hypothetical protein